MGISPQYFDNDGWHRDRHLNSHFNYKRISSRHLRATHYDHKNWPVKQTKSTVDDKERETVKSRQATRYIKFSTTMFAISGNKINNIIQ